MTSQHTLGRTEASGQADAAPPRSSSQTSAHSPPAVHANECAQTPPSPPSTGNASLHGDSQVSGGDTEILTEPYPLPSPPANKPPMSDACGADDETESPEAPEVDRPALVSQAPIPYKSLASYAFLLRSQSGTQFTGAPESEDSDGSVNAADNTEPH